jgi:cation diffusion facilitator family transporter
MAEIDNKQAQMSRDRIIIRTSVIGILANLVLAAFKAVIGILTNSIAVTLDAVNNMSDALSSVVTIIGTKLAGKKPDKKHPLGYGRIEYLSTMVIAAIVLYAGITSMTESIDKIVNPELPDYSTVSLVIIASAIVVKVVLGRYVKHVGEKVNSGSLVASGTDALFDAILSTSVLLSAIIFILWDVSLEAYVGAIISIFIIKSGIEMIRDAVDEILGKRADKEYTDAIKETICEEEGVTGAYDLILHSYGPDRMIGSVHVEVPADMTAGKIDTMERNIAKRVFLKHGVIIAGVGIYSNDDSDECLAMRTEITRIVMSHDGILQMHGFRVDAENKVINLDIIIDYALDDRESLYAQICGEIQERYPEYSIEMVLDIDI